jgi:hypothetical protein
MCRVVVVSPFPVAALPLPPSSSPMAHGKHASIEPSGWYATMLQGLSVCGHNRVVQEGRGRGAA